MVGGLKRVATDHYFFGLLVCPVFTLLHVSTRDLSCFALVGVVTPVVFL